ncbi:MAG TPA: response regulator [Anaerolineae bacterium]|nr:response regulator [Anaerolineae bacterium]
MTLRILLADDNAINRELVTLSLGHLGYVVDVVTNGEEVLTLLETEDYGLILMDIEMPKVDGPTATARIRAELPAERQPYIVALTGNSLPADREYYTKVGMNGYVGKPFGIEALERAVAEAEAYWAEQ